MIKQSATGLVTRSVYCFGERIAVDIEGVEVEFELQEFNGGDDRTRNINLLGTNCLNHVVLIDDFVSQRIMILKRSTPPETRV